MNPSSAIKPHYDVIVAGGGPAGVAAAIASARTGADTLLIEPNGYLGGTVTHASLPAFCPYTDGHKPVVRGIGLEILEALKKDTWRSPFYDSKPDRTPVYDWLPIDTEALKRVLDRMVLESGCQPLFYARAVDCRTEGPFIREVTIQTPSGLSVISADAFIDCTGDGYLSARAGCMIEYGDESGAVQSGTLCFKVGNIDIDRFMAYANEVGENGNLMRACARAIEAGDFPAGETKVSGIAFTAPGVAALNFGHVYDIDPLDAVSLTRAEMAARAQTDDLLRFLRTYVPGAENAVLVSSGPQLGVRESRRVMGRYVLTREDYIRRADFEDAIAYYCYPIDLHGAHKNGAENKELDEIYRTQKYQPGEVYGIPLRSLVPLGMDNLLTAGRIISCDRSMMGSVRVVPCCFATGQAAGTAAALAVRSGQPVSATDAQTLRRALAADGCWLKNP